MPEKINGMLISKSSYFIAIYLPGSAWEQDKLVDEQPFFHGHVQFLKELYNQKKLIAAGPFTQNATESAIGMAIIEAADLSDAESVLEFDPMIKNKILRPDFHYWRAAIGGQIFNKQL